MAEQIVISNYSCGLAGSSNTQHCSEHRLDGYVVRIGQFIFNNKYLILINNVFEFSRQYKYLQLEKPSGFENEIPIQKTLTINLLKGMAKRTPLGLIGLMKGPFFLNFNFGLL